ncbi:uncharacterized protein [Narcine bancroftii]|uniref:uncharacterized protein n=1 Tax=Narcine bancroftii TaxID=1343680 RepID=UPI003831F3EC
MSKLEPKIGISAVKFGLYPQGLTIWISLKELQKTGLKLKGEQEILKPQQEVPIAEKQEKHCLQANSEIKVSDHPDFERQENYSQEVQEQKPNFKIGSTLGETENIGIEKWATVIGLPKGVQEKELYLSASQASKENFLEKDCLMFPDSYTRENEASGTDHTEITEARIKLEKLKQSLSKKEEEITELLKNKNKLKSDFRISAKHQLDHSDATSLLLLKRILEKFHSVYSRVPEAQQFIDCLLKESERKAMTAKETLKRVQDNVVDSRQVVRGNPTEFNRCLEEAQTELWEAEIIVKALGSIRSGFINEQLDSIMAGDECGLQEGKGRASSTAHHGKCEERTVSWFAYKGQTILGSQHVLISQEGTFPKETEEGKATGPHLDNLLQGYN